jgi:hypothetical protein
MKTRNFKIRLEPKKPTEKTIKKQHIDIYDDESLSSIVSSIPENISFDDITFHITYDDDYETAFIEYTVEETDEEFAIRVKRYDEQIVIYNKWLEENKEQLEIREKEQKEKREKQKENELAKIEKDINRLQKQAEKLKKE